MKAFIKDNYKKYIIFTIANLLAAINFNLLLKPINLVAGGSPGLALVINKIVPLSTSEIITIIYVITFILSAVLLDRKTLIGIVYASIIYPLFIYLTEDIINIIRLSYSDLFLVAIISGIISGIGNGLIYKNGFASSGLSVISPILHKYFKVSISSANFVMNAIIVLLGGWFFGINSVLYAIVLLYISSYIINIIILGKSSNKIMFIKTKKEEKIKELLHVKYHITPTIFEEDSNTVLMVVMHNNLYYPIKNDLLSTDHSIRFITNDCYEVGK